MTRRFLVLCLLLAGCAKLAPNIPADPKVLRVGISPDSFPYVYQQAGKTVGLEIEFARTLATELGRNPTFVELKRDQLIPALEAGRIDIVMSGLTISDELSMRVRFSDPYLKMSQMILTHTGDAARYLYPQVVLMSEARIGALKDSMGDSLLKNATRNAKRKTYSTMEKATTALLNKRVDAVIGDGPVILALGAVHAREGLTAMSGTITTEYLAWAVQRDDQELQDQVDRALAKWNKNGTIDTLLHRALPFL